MIDREALHRYVGRVLALHDERAGVNAQIHDVYEEAKNAGFVTALLRQIVREQQMEAEERASQYSILDNYRHALGMLGGTPLGEAAMERAAAAPVERPLPFRSQPIKGSSAGRPRKKKPTLDELLADARGLADDMGEPAGAA
jgi:uncharacterized protein (UPF0335 family)